MPSSRAHSGAGFKIRAHQQRNFGALLKIVERYGGWVDLAAPQTEWTACGHDDEAAYVIFFDLVEDFFVRGTFGGVKGAEVRHH